MTANSSEYLLVICILLGIGHASYHNLLGWVTSLSFFHTRWHDLSQVTCKGTGLWPNSFAQLSVFLITSIMWKSGLSEDYKLWSFDLLETLGMPQRSQCKALALPRESHPWEKRWWYSQRGSFPGWQQHCLLFDSRSSWKGSHITHGGISLESLHGQAVSGLLDYSRPLDAAEHLQLASVSGSCSTPLGRWSVSTAALTLGVR